MKNNNDIIKNISSIQDRKNFQSKLQQKLKEKTTEYINNIWKHSIEIDIQIESNLNCNIHIKDKGKNNTSDFYEMSERSAGAIHFLSLIFSLSIENEIGINKNRLILIDEPETHLHPSAIVDLGKELLRLGKNNYVFVATHSPYLIDKKNKQRNIIIKKNDNSITKKKQIRENQSIIDDEVLRDAFGIDVYRDLLNPHSICVEGLSDKVILEKALKLIGLKNVSITNGKGSNIDTLASKLNEQGISVLFILDDDKDGKRYKENIIKINADYKNKVFTIRDLVGDIKEGGTIEDVLAKEFIEGILKKMGHNNIELKNNVPFLSQINKKKEDEMNKIKTKIAEDFNPTKKSLQEQCKLLYQLANKIKEKLNPQ